MSRRSRTARVATRAKAGNGVRRTTGTKAPKPTELDDDLDGLDTDDSDDDTDAGDDDTDDSDDDTDPETEFLAGLTPEQAKFYSDSTGGLKTKLTKANANARKHRLARAALQAGGTGTGTGTQPPKPGPAKKDAPVDQDALLATLKAEMPGLFKAPRRKPAAGPGGPKKATGSKSTLGTELDKLFG